MLARTMSSNQSNENLKEQNIQHQKNGEIVNMAYIEEQAKTDLENRKNNNLFYYSSSMIGVSAPQIFDRNNEKIIFATPSLSPEINTELFDADKGIMYNPTIPDELKKYLRKQLNEFFEYYNKDIMTKLRTINTENGSTYKEVMSNRMAKGSSTDITQKDIQSPARQRDFFHKINTTEDYNELSTASGSIIFNHGFLMVNYGNKNNNNENTNFTILSAARNLDSLVYMCNDYDTINSEYPIVEFIEENSSITVNPVSWEELETVSTIYENKKHLLQNVNAAIPTKWFIENPNFTEQQLQEKLKTVKNFKKDSDLLISYKPTPSKNINQSKQNNQNNQNNQKRKKPPVSYNNSKKLGII